MSVKSVTVVCDRCKKEDQIMHIRKKTKLQRWVTGEICFAPLDPFEWQEIDLCYDCKKELWRLVTNWCSEKV